MWYVIQVPAGREDYMSRLIIRADTDLSVVAGRERVVRECFVPTCELERKRQGVWRKLRLPLYPGYVVADAERAEELNELLRATPEFTRLLRVGESFTPLSRAECALIQTYADERDRCVRMSVGVIEGDTVRVVSGPLRGREGCIKEVNRRAGTALLEVQMFGRTTTAKVGLAIVAKRGEQQHIA